MERLISIQAASEKHDISTRWIWKLIRVDKILSSKVVNGRVYILETEWDEFCVKNHKLVAHWNKIHRHLRARYTGIRN